MRGAAGAHPPALPVQQHEHDRRADAQRPDACGGGRSRTSPTCSARRCARRARVRWPKTSSRSRAPTSAIERLRLGERLPVDWKVDDVADGALVPALMLQPLLENADLPRHRAARAEAARSAWPAGGDGAGACSRSTTRWRRASSRAATGHRIGARQHARSASSSCSMAKREGRRSIEAPERFVVTLRFPAARGRRA